jgi:uncharacterized membrane protein
MPPPPPPAPGIPPSPGIPPGAGYTAYAPGGIAAPQIDVGDSISWSIKKFQQYLGPFLTLSGVIIVVQAIGGIIAWQLRNHAGTQLTINQQTGALETTSSFWGGLVGALVISIIFGIVVFLLRIGLLRAALRTSSGEAPSMADLTTGRNTGAFILTSIAVAALYFVGFILCVIPGLLVMFFLVFAPTHSLDKGAGVGDSLRWSFEAVKTNVVPVLILVLILVVAGIISAFFRGIGGVVIAAILGLFLEPFGALLNANVYRKLGQEPIAPVEA